MMNLSTRPICRLADLSDIADIAVLFDAYRQFYGQTPDLAGAEAFLRTNLEKGFSVLYKAAESAEPGAAVLGFAQLYPTWSSISMKRVWTLNDLFVLPHARGRGAGRSLLEAAAGYARGTGAKGIELATATGNARARQLYEQAGYAEDTEFVHYFLNLEGL